MNARVRCHLDEIAALIITTFHVHQTREMTLRTRTQGQPAARMQRQHRRPLHERRYEQRLLPLQRCVCRKEPQNVSSSYGHIILGRLTPIREAQMLPPPLITSTSFPSYALLFLCTVQSGSGFPLYFFRRNRRGEQENDCSPPLEVQSH